MAESSDWMVLTLGGDLVKPPPADSETVSYAELDREFTEVALGGPSKRYILIYFAGRWCPSTQVFNPRIRNAYAELVKSEALELVWVSTDVSEVAYAEHLKELQFLAVPWLPPKLEDLLKAYDVNATPTLLVLDIADGTVLARDGVLGIEKFTNYGGGPLDAHALLEDWDEKLMQKHVTEEEAAGGKAEDEEGGQAEEGAGEEEGTKQDDKDENVEPKEEARMTLVKGALGEFYPGDDAE